ncbi:rho guanine nucleotide exchange factor 2-like [Cyanistes caeruleus]|uniref:rho guanine nucleotide exchange factor 2-like n=1 Tax=Cyanistes caeruleus TaxID=156563 RepID=UPI000CDA8BC1|nr:rho guanine nucleotide exchange factor 2-like [Cyanistes caeruleus]
MRFSKTKGRCCTETQTGEEWIESSPEKDLGEWVDKKLTMPPQQWQQHKLSCEDDEGSEQPQGGPSSVPPLSPPDAIRERPNSAIYPSESFRQTLLGPRRGRPSLSLSKSVSTTNISGTFNDDSPLGIRRILSQSTDSLNMRNRTLSVESLIDEGPDVILSQLLSDLEADGKEFEADSWSLAVDNSFLQQHRMDVMKRQDVIYENGPGSAWPPLLSPAPKVCSLAPEGVH